MMSFLDDVKAASEAGKASKQVDVLVNGNLHALKFYRADGDVWAETVARHPARADALLDLKFGYNFNAVVIDIGLLTGRFIEDDVEHEFPLDRDDQGKVIEPRKSSAWESFIDGASGHEVGRIADAVWALNEWDPMQEIEKAKKASRRSRGSRAKSA